MLEISSSTLKRGMYMPFDAIDIKFSARVAETFRKFRVCAPPLLSAAGWTDSGVYGHCNEEDRKSLNRGGNDGGVAKCVHETWLKHSIPIF